MEAGTLSAVLQGGAGPGSAAPQRETPRRRTGIRVGCEAKITIRIKVYDVKFDKETLFAFIICLVILFGWDPLCRYMGWYQPVPAAANAAVATTEGSTTADAESGNAAAAAENASAPEENISPEPGGKPAIPPAEKPLEPLPRQILRNEKLALTLDPLAGFVESITLEQYLDASRTAPVTIDQTSNASVGALGIRDLQNRWYPVQVVKNQLDGNVYTLIRLMRTLDGRQFELEQQFELDGDYTTSVHYTFRNRSDVPLRFERLVVNGGDVAPWMAVSGDKVRIPSHRMDFLTADGKFVDLKADVKDAKFFQNPPPQVVWAGAGNKYFVSLLASDKPFMLYQERGSRILNNRKDSTTILTVGAQSEMELAAGEEKSLTFRFYAGPKVIDLLDDFAPEAGRVMHLAWGPLDYLARLLLWALVGLHGWCHSYGVSIIILTLLVRILFYPATAKANASMKRMQIIQPKLQELREKYKDNPQLLSAKTMELYRTEKINPFGGCLPILLQIPVFFALYATLDGAVELRQVPFLWAHDLAAADTVLRIPLYFFTLPINPLVLIMTALMIVQQRMTPMAMDPMQKKMMMAMPIVMLIFLYDLPSGLTLYWTVSNIFSIIQLRLQRRNRAQTMPAPAAGKQ